MAGGLVLAGALHSLEKWKFLVLPSPRAPALHSSPSLPSSLPPFLHPSSQPPHRAGTLLPTAPNHHEARKSEVLPAEVDNVVSAPHDSGLVNQLS